MADGLPPAAALAREAAGIATRMSRPDLAQRLSTAATRVARPATVVCVVGEFKQGKSSLVNALLGQAVCPVDDDVATSALTLLRYGEDVQVIVRRKDGDKVVVVEIPPSTLRDWVTEGGNPDNERQVERVDVVLPHPLLADGLVIVDTPGMGSMGAGHAANTLAFLPFADGLVFVSDASAELSAPEVDFLKRARDLCPMVVVALTKIDLYPEWRRILEIDGGHLDRVGVGASIVGLSAPVRFAALRRSDRELNERSGFPRLRAALDGEVVGPAKVNAGRRALVEVAAALDQLEQPAAAELAVLRDPDRLAATVAALDEARARLEQLRGPGARWSTVVGDRIADLNNDVSYRFRGAIRQINRTFDEAIESLKTAEEWDELGRRLQTEVAEAVTDVFQSIERGALDVAAEALQVVGQDAADLPPLGGRNRGVEVLTLWAERPVAEQGSRAGRGLSSAVTGLRGAQGGMVMFGTMGRFLPTGAAALLLSNPVTIGLGVAFGGMQLLDAHRRKIAQRRQQARVNVRQFLDDVQFEVGNAMGEALREVQRSLRDELGGRVSELQRTYAESVRVAQEAVQGGEAAQAERMAALDAVLRSIAQLRSHAAELTTS
jgi:hypothetical protein